MEFGAFQTVYGGFQFMEKFNVGLQQMKDLCSHPDYKARNKKLAPGTYVTPVKIEDGKVLPLAKEQTDDSTIYILNDFNPGQIDGFTKPEVRIAAFRIRKSDKGASLEKMKNDVVGPTDPAKGNGIRNFIYKNKETFGADTVNLSQNCFHFSAGNIEAMAELSNFFGIRPEFSIMGRLLMEHASYSAEELYKLILSPIVEWNGVKRSVFDHTEIISPEKVLEFARDIKGQL
jgi:hypothetical protein